MKTMSAMTQQVASDRCDRCGGLMVSEWIGDWSMDGECWRRILCGERLDPVILAHRRDQDGRT